MFLRIFLNTCQDAQQTLLSFVGQCTTPVYKKSNGQCACGFFLDTGLTWQQARDECHAQGARLPGPKAIKNYICTLQMFIMS
jgi:hypothetical protein